MNKREMRRVDNRRRAVVLTLIPLFLAAFAAAAAGQTDLAALEKDFRLLPQDARRLTGPLFWLHGNESRERLEMYLEKVAEGGNGCFTAESRPHNDWLGPGWYRDLGICLQQAKKLDLKMWIFDEQWWPSGEVGGKVPQQYGSKYMEAAATEITGPGKARVEIPGNLIAVIAGKSAGEGVDGESLVDLTDRAANGRLAWDAPAGSWKVMVFTWRSSEGRRGRLLVDGASRDAVEWYIQTVYQPHYDHFPGDFGKTIAGYFYDEPETYGDWGTEVIPMLKERGIDWKKALVAWKFSLADGDEQVAARYQYQDALAEAWGRTLYGGLARWCRERRVESIGHFLEHSREYLDPKLCAGNMVQLMKYSDMGAIDAVFRQFVPGKKDDSTYQTPKLGSSISHAYGKRDDLAMVEIFGARGQDLSYPEMKWWTDRMHTSGINFHIPHSFNPQSPWDRDCPPYFYNGGYEPRFPLYRVYADYTSRLSLMLSGGRHVCPVALLYLGNSFHAGRAIPPEEMTTALEDALFDCDWIPYDVFEQDMTIAGPQLGLREERYRVLVVPAAETIPHAVLAKARDFFAAGGVVLGYGILPSRSATLGKSSEDIQALSREIWGERPSIATSRPAQTNAAGGKAFFLPEKPTPRQIQEVLTAGAAIHPTMEAIEGETDDWLHVLHRVKAGCDVFFIANQEHEGQVKQFRLRFQAGGTPEIWDAMRNTIERVPFQRIGAEAVELDLTLAPLESALIVFQPQVRELPQRIGPGAKLVADPIAAVRLATPAEKIIPSRPPVEPVEKSPLEACSWVWYPEASAHQSAAPGVRYFRKSLALPAGAKVARAQLRLTADNEFVAYLNGKQVGSGNNWQRTASIDLAPGLRPGENILAVKAVNVTDAPNPAGLIGCYEVQLAGGQTVAGQIDKTWKAGDREAAGWNLAGFDDGGWGQAKEVVKFGGSPWDRLDAAGALTASPVRSDPFIGRFTLPESWVKKGLRICLEMDEVAPEEAAAVRVNGQFAGGLIGKPLRLDITAHARSGENTLEIEPFAPAAVRVAAYPSVP